MKTNKYDFLIFCLSLFIFTGCAEQNLNSKDGNETSIVNTKDNTQEILSPKEFTHWVKEEKSPVKKEKAIGEFLFSALYKPYEYIICMEERNNSLPDTLLKRRIKEIDDMEYYDLKIELKNGKNELLKYNLSSPQQYTDRVNYFAFGMEKDIKLVVDGKDTILCGLYHFERAYDVVPFVKVVVGFKKSSEKFKEKTLIFHDKIFENGIIKFHYTKKELNNIPKLKTI